MGTQEVFYLDKPPWNKINNNDLNYYKLLSLLIIIEKQEILKLSSEHRPWCDDQLWALMGPYVSPSQVRLMILSLNMPQF